MRALDRLSRLSPVASIPAPSLRGELRGLPLSPREAQMLAAYARLGDRRLASDHLGMAPHTGVNHLTKVYAKLGVSGALEAFRERGWLRVR